MWCWPCSAEVNTAWSFTYTPPYAVVECGRADLQISEVNKYLAWFLISRVKPWRHRHHASVGDGSDNTTGRNTVPRGRGSWNTNYVSKLKQTWTDAGLISQHPKWIRRMYSFLPYVEHGFDARRRTSDAYRPAVPAYYTHTWRHSVLRRSGGRRGQAIVDGSSSDSSKEPTLRRTRRARADSKRDKKCHQGWIIERFSVNCYF